MKTSGTSLLNPKSNSGSHLLNSDHPSAPNTEAATLLQVIRDEAARLLEGSHGQLSANQTQSVQRIHASATQLLRDSGPSRKQDGGGKPPSASDSQRSSILIVDDEASLREILRALLSEHGYQLTEAVDGRDAIQKLDSIRPDLVLLDMALPDIDGWDVIRHIKGSPHLKHVRVLVLSGLPLDDGQIVALKSLTWGFIGKSSDFRLETVQDRVAQILDRGIYGWIALPLGRITREVLAVIWPPNAATTVSTTAHCHKHQPESSAGNCVQPVELQGPQPGYPGGKLRPVSSRLPASTRVVWVRVLAENML